MKNWRIASVIVFFVSLVSLRAHADIGCNNLRMDTTTSVNFSSGSAQEIPITVRRNNTNHGCTYFIVFSRGFSSNYNRAMFKGAASYSYQLYRTFPYTDVLKDLSDVVTSSDMVSDSFPDNAGSMQNTDSYRAVLGSAGLSPVGLYMDSVTVRLYEGSLSNYVLRDTANVNISYSVTRSIDLSLVSSGSAFNANSTSMTLDFGTMYTGESRAFDIVIQTNAGYSLAFSSLNGGNMKHTSLSGATIPYLAYVNGSPVALGSSSTVVATGSGTSPSGGNRIPVSLAIGSLSNGVSGNYGDSITVSVQTTE